MKISEPWEYYYTDNFLPEDQYNSLLDQCKSLFKDSTKDVDRYILDHDPTPQIKNYMNYFNEKRGYYNLAKFIHLTSTKANFVHPMHVDSEFKIMSAVLYLGEDNNGTRIYAEKDGEVVAEVDWKPNRLFVFCGKNDVTWHDYTSKGQRFTYNYFVVDPSKIENPEYKSGLVKF